MKMGFVVAYRRDISRVVLSTEKIELSDFIRRSECFGVKFEAQDVYILPYHLDHTYAEKFWKAAVDAVILFTQDSTDPQIASVIRNTSLFGISGPIVGDVPKITLSLLDVIHCCRDSFPEMPELPKEHECGVCGRSLPEPDGFGGVHVQSVTEDYSERLCFSCYMKRIAVEKISFSGVNCRD